MTQTSEVVKEKIKVCDIRTGMYICELDRPWLDSPFPLQGFFVEDKQDIKQIQSLCSFVYIDVRRTIEREVSDIGKENSTAFSTDDKEFINKVQYKDKTSLEEELKVADGLYQSLSQQTREIMRSLVNNKKLDLIKLRESTGLMVESIIRNPDAFLWLVRLKREGSYIYQHSVSCAVWAVAFGRQLGLRKRELNRLALGAALLDVGKLSLPKELIDRPGKLSPAEFDVVKDHVQMSIEMVSQCAEVDKKVVEMIATHHERFDGNGYPRKVKRLDIPLFGRIAAIVDCYDAISSPRPYSPPMAPADAVRKLYEWRNVDFQPALVEVFIQALGIYPAGSLVELTTGEVGVVLSEYRTRRLRPKLMLLLDNEKCFLEKFPVLDLFKCTHTEGGVPINIKQSLEPGAYGLDPSVLLIG